MKNHLFNAILALNCLLLFSACSSGSSGGSSTEGEKKDGEHQEEALPEGYVQLTRTQWETIGGKLAKPEMRQVSGVVRASGRLDVPPQNTITVTALLGGVVRYTKVLEGMRVKKGDLLVTVHNPDLPDLERRYVAAFSASKQLNLELERQKELRKDEVNAVKTLEQARANYQTAAAETKSLALQLVGVGLSPARIEAGQFTDTYQIKAPISGFISHISINLGQRLSPTDPVFDIVDTEHLHAELAVFERDLFKLKKGQQIHFTLPSQNDRELTAHVYLIGKTLEADRTVRVHGHLDTEDPGLVPGIYLQATVETGGEKSQVVPSNAIIREGGKTFIYIPTEIKQQTNNKTKDEDDEKLTFRRVEVLTGEAIGDKVSVRLLEMGVTLNTVVGKGSFFVNSTLKQAQGGEEGEEHGQ